LIGSRLRERGWQWFDLLDFNRGQDHDRSLRLTNL
jgi:hypothetical protein